MAGQAARLTPRVGDYLTDGKRLVSVLALGRTTIEVEDCILRDSWDEYEVAVLERASLPDWRRVKPDAKE